jgi:hypothetical protein
MNRITQNTRNRKQDGRENETSMGKRQRMVVINRRGNSKRKKNGNTRKTRTGEIR